MIQGSEEWKLARCGKVGASRVADIMAKTKTGWGASRDNYLHELLLERLNGVPTEGYKSAAMIRGTETEPEARRYYEVIYDVDVAQVGFIGHPKIRMAGASPDGLVGKDGVLEIKCPEAKEHVATLLGKAIPARYLIQMQFQMACTGRQWCHFVSYHPEFPGKMKMFEGVLKRDDAVIKQLEDEVRVFLKELDAKVIELSAAYDVVPKVAA
jgi:putative phage-type endonuclease